MKKRFLLIVPLLLTGCMEEKISKLDVEMFNADGDSLGNITLTEKAQGLEFALDLSGLTPGVHAIHVHDSGNCQPPDFKSAGDHFNPDQKKHGLLHPEGSHAGDLPNIIVKEDQTVKVTFMAPQVTLRDGKTSLFTKKGTSIVINDQADDGMSQPAGDAGDRIACGVIAKKSAQKKAQDQ
ncbi:superoxide dismutase family protein [Bacillaceae bacterium Marseille-Q3522]|nr:superoxide dismutase family protein [Bacillaceae bacterium Marseille-Q3522]